MFPFTVVPAYNLPVYASQCPLPVITQDSVRGCRLGFAAVAIPGDMVSCAFKAQTGSAEAVTRLRLPQNVACSFPALRSSSVDLRTRKKRATPKGKAALNAAAGARTPRPVRYLLGSRFHGRRFISLHRWPCLPLHGDHVASEQSNARWPLPHVAGSPDPGVLSASLTAAGSLDRSCLLGLAGPTSFRLNPTALPCSHGTF